MFNPFRRRSQMPHRKHAQPAARRRMAYEPLESRRMLAGDVVVDWNDGTIKITGTEAADVITISETNVNGERALSVTSKGSIRFTDEERQIPPRALQGMQGFTIYGLGGDDAIVNNTNVPMYIAGGDGNDLLVGGGGNDFIRGGPGDDTIDGGEDSDTLYGDDGNDRIYGGVGGNGDTIYAGFGHDQVDGGAGNDLLIGDYGQDVVRGGPGDDTIDGGEDSDTLYGDDGNDGIYGGIGGNGDTIYGGMGADTIDGGGGDDIIHGGADGDQELVARLQAEHGFQPYGTGWYFNEKGWQEKWFADRHSRWHLIKPDGSLYQYGGGVTTFVAQLPTSIYDNPHVLFQATGVDGDDIIGGGAGNDHIEGDDGRDLIRGGAGDDVIDGGRESDWLHGDDGNDYVYGGLSGDGDDIYGGFGDDQLEGGDGNDLVIGDYGQDVIRGGAGHDTIDGGEDSDTLYGDDGNDRIYGGVGGNGDAIYGGTGIDDLDGGAGNDVLHGDAGDDLLRGNAGDDTAFGGAGDDILIGGHGNDYLNDSLGGNNILLGNSGNDTLYAGQGFAGNNFVDGGEGDDIIAVINSLAVAPAVPISRYDVIRGGSGVDFVSVEGTKWDDWIDVLPTGSVADSARLADLGMTLTSDAIYVRREMYAGQSNVLFRIAADGETTAISSHPDAAGDANTEDFVATSVVVSSADGSLAYHHFEGIERLEAYGLDGDDRMEFHEGLEHLRFRRFYGHAGADLLIGAELQDYLVGGDGDDLLWGKGKPDNLAGDHGNDVLIGGDDTDFLRGGAGDDLLISESLIDVNPSDHALTSFVKNWSEERKFASLVNLIVGDDDLDPAAEDTQGANVTIESPSKLVVDADQHVWELRPNHFSNDATLFLDGNLLRTGVRDFAVAPGGGHYELLSTGRLLHYADHESQTVRELGVNVQSFQLQEDDWYALNSQGRLFTRDASWEGVKDFQFNQQGELFVLYINGALHRQAAAGTVHLGGGFAQFVITTDQMVYGLRTSGMLETLDASDKWTLVVAGLASIDNVDGLAVLHTSTDTLMLYGTDESDDIRISAFDETQLVVATSQGSLLVDRGVSANSSVARIVVHANGGDDRVINTTDIPMTAHGGAGHDLLIGGDGIDELNGDQGNYLSIGVPDPATDTLTVGSDHDSLIANNAITYDPLTGEVTVMGTDQADAFLLEMRDGRFVVLAGRNDGNPLTETANFDPAGHAISQVVIVGGDGDDVVHNRTFFATAINGGVGDDVISGPVIRPGSLAAASSALPKSLSARANLFFWNAESGVNQVSLLAPTGDSFVSQANTLDPQGYNGRAFHTVVAGDFDNDGQEDLFFWNPHDGNNRILYARGEREGRPYFDPVETPISVGGLNGWAFEKVVAGDFDGDGNDDLFFWHTQTGYNRVVFGGNRTNDQQDVPISVGGISRGAFQHVVVGNFNGDGIDDLFFWNPLHGYNRVLHMQGRSNGLLLYRQTDHPIGAGGISGWDFHQVVPGDFDADGRDDLFFWNPADGNNRIVFDAAFSRMQDRPIDMLGLRGSAFRSVLAGNFNGDGADDVLFWNAETGGNKAFFNAVQAGYQEHALDPALVRAYRFNLVVAGDFFAPVTTIAHGGDGNDTIFGGPQTVADGNKGNDTLIGNAGRDTLIQDDRVSYDAATGQILVVGESKSERLRVIDDNGRLLVYASSSDAVSEKLAAVFDLRRVRVTGLTLLGGEGNDTIINGSTVPAVLVGGPGNDSLTGGSDDDVLYGDTIGSTLEGLITADSILKTETFRDPAYATGHLVGGSDWYGADMRVANDKEHLGGAVIDGFQTTRPAELITARLDFLTPDEAGTLTDQMLVFSFDAYAGSGVNGGHRSHGSGVGINEKAMWYVHRNGLWAFDARPLTGTYNATVYVPGGIDQAVRLSVVVDAKNLQVYGRYDFGDGFQETARFPIKRAQLRELYNVAVVQDWRQYSGGIQVANISVARVAAADDVLHGGNGNDTLYAGPGIDRLYGENNNDFVYGDKYDAQLDGNTGADSVIRSDRIDYDPATGTVSVFGTDRADRLRIVPSEGKLFVYVGDVQAGPASDELLAIFHTTVNRIVIDGGRGNDFIENLSNVQADLVGGAGSDTVLGGSNADTIYADTPDNSLEGLIGEEDLLLVENFTHETYDDGTLAGGKWYGADLRVAEDTEHVGGMVIDGFQTLRPGELVSAKRNFLAPSEARALTDQTLVLTFDAFAASGADGVHRSHGSGVGINEKAMWYVHRNGTWIFDVRPLTGTYNATVSVPGGTDRAVRLSVVVDAKHLQVYGRYDFGGGFKETARFSMTPAQLSELYNVAVVQDWRPSSGGIQVANIAVFKIAAADDTIDGRDGNDILYGGPGVDRLSGEDHNDFLYGDQYDAQLDGNTGADSWVRGNLVRYDQANGIVSVTGTEKNDRIRVVPQDGKVGIMLGDAALDASTDVMVALFDVAYAKVNQIVIDGGDGNDTIVNNTNVSAVILGGRGADQITGGGGQDIIYGDSLGNTLDGLISGPHMLKIETFESSAYANGHLIGPSKWYGADMRITEDAKHLTGSAIDGFQATRPGELVTAKLDFLSTAEAGQLGEEMLVLSFDAFASSGANGLARSHGALVGFNEIVTWGVHRNGSWIFDARRLTGLYNSTVSVPGGIDQAVRLSIVVDAKNLVVYGGYDFGEGFQETARFSITRAQLAQFYNISVAQDWRPHGGGIQVGNLAVARLASTDDTIHGGDGNDVLYAGPGVDRLFGQNHNDFVYGDRYDAQLEGNSGADSWIRNDLVAYDPTNGIVSVMGTVQNDRIRVVTHEGKVGIMLGDASQDVSTDVMVALFDVAYATVNQIVIHAGQGDDIVHNQTDRPAVIDGGEGKDTLVGGGGDDHFIGRGDGEFFNGAGGANTLDYSAYDQAVATYLNSGWVRNRATGQQIDTLDNIWNFTGTRFDDDIAGDDHNNVLYGGPGHDTIAGSTGNDLLIGGAGRDILNRNAGIVGQSDDIGSVASVGITGIGPIATSVTANGIVYILSEHGDVYRDAGGDNWDKITGDRITTLATANNNVYVLTDRGDVYRYTGGGNQWNKITGDPITTLVVADGNVYVRTGQGDIYRYTGGGNSWDKITGSPISTLVAADQKVYVLTTEGDVYRYTGRGNSWNKITGSPIRTLVAANDQVYVLITQGDVYRYTGSGNSWNKITGDPIGTLVAADDQVYVLTASADVYRYTGVGNSWDKITGDRISKLLTADDKVLAMTTQGDVYRYTGGGNQWDRILTSVQDFYVANGLQIYLANNVLYVQGTSGNDHLEFWRNDGRVHIKSFLPDLGIHSDLPRTWAMPSRIEVNGGAGNDTIANKSVLSQVVIRGGDGDDTLFRLNDIDALYGDAGNDVLEGSNSVDAIYFAGNVLHVEGTSNDDSAIEDDNVHYDAKTGVVTIVGSEAGDRLRAFQSEGKLWIYAGKVEGTASDQYAAVFHGQTINRIDFHGLGGDDLIDNDTQYNAVIDGGAGQDTLLGGSGDDHFLAHGDHDQFNGRGGVNTLDYANHDKAILAYLNSGTIRNVSDPSTNIDTLDNIWNLIGTQFDDELWGDEHMNALSGGAGNDTLYGLAHEDTLEGGDGDDVMDGGSDRDTLTYAGAENGGVTVEMRNGTSRGQGNDRFSGFENVVGTRYRDDIYGDDQNGNHLFGGAGDDLLVGHAGNDTLDGGEGDDTLEGGNDNDTLVGGPGNDRLRGGILGETEGGDMVNYSQSPGTVIVHLGHNYANDGFGGRDSLDEIEIIVGSQHSDTLLGSDYANAIYGLAGNDTIDGRGGEDILNGGTGSDTINGGDGVDTVSYADAIRYVEVNLLIGRADDTGYDTLLNLENIVGSQYNDILVGNHGPNHIVGLGGRDWLYGRGGNDALFGGDGNDELDGDDGNDTLVGGDGNDTMRGGNDNDIMFAGTGSDVMEVNKDADSHGNDVYYVEYAGWLEKRGDWRFIHRTDGSVVTVLRNNWDNDELFFNYDPAYVQDHGFRSDQQDGMADDWYNVDPVSILKGLGLMMLASPAISAQTTPIFQIPVIGEFLQSKITGEDFGFLLGSRLKHIGLTSGLNFLTGGLGAAYSFSPVLNVGHTSTPLGSLPAELRGAYLVSKTTNQGFWDVYKQSLLTDGAIAASLVGGFGMTTMAAGSTATGTAAAVAPQVLKVAAWFQQSLAHQVLGGVIGGALSSVGSQSLNSLLLNQKLKLDWGSVFTGAATGGLGAIGVLTPFSGAGLAKLGNTAAGGLMRANLAGFGSLLGGRDYIAGFGSTLLSIGVGFGTHQVFEIVPQSVQDVFVGRLAHNGLQSAVAASITAAVIDRNIGSDFLTGFLQGASSPAFEYLRDALLASYLLPAMVAIASPINVDIDVIYDDQASFEAAYTVKIGPYQFEFIQGKYYFRLLPDGFHHGPH